MDKKNCVFQARDTGVPARMPLFVNGLHPAPFAIASDRGRRRRRPRRCARPPRRASLERFAPPHVVVNEEGDIVHYSTRTGKYLEAAYGAPTRQLLTTARKELRLDLRSCLREAIETRRPVTREATSPSRPTTTRRTGCR